MIDRWINSCALLILGNDNTMLSTLCGDKTALLVHVSISNRIDAKRWLLTMKGVILIVLLLKYPNGPKTHTNRFTYDESSAMVLHDLEEAVKSGIGVQCADGHTGHTFPWIASFLADYPELRNIRMVKNGWCPQCETCLEYMPGFARRAMHCHPQWYLHLSTTATKEMGLWKIATWPNIANSL